MKKTQRLKYIITAPLFIFAVVIAQLGFTADVEAASRTWTGAGDGTSMSDGANWSGGTAPSNGDEIVLPGRAPQGQTVNYNSTLNFDLPGVALSRVTLQPSASPDATYSNSGYTLKDAVLANDATIVRIYATPAQGNGTYHVNAWFDDLVAQGNLTVRSYEYSAIQGQVAGDLIVEQGAFSYTNPRALAVTGAVRVKDNASFSYRTAITARELIAEEGGSLNFSYDSPNVTLPVTLGRDATAYFNNNWDNNDGPAVYTLSGAFKLVDGVSEVAADQNVTVNITGPITASNYGQVYLHEDNVGVVNFSTLPKFEYRPVAIDGDLNQSFSTERGTQASLNGSRSTVGVMNNSILVGTGSAGLMVNIGTVSPGGPIGTMTVRDLYASGDPTQPDLGVGTLRIDMQNAQTYDKMVVGAEYSASYTSQGFNSPFVIATNSPLQLAFAEGWSFAQGDVFTIVDNLSDQPIQGTFANLAEGGRISLDGVTFAISYTGGTGNDITLTALNSATQPIPGTPNTGAQILELAKANPAVVAVLGLISVAALFFATRRARTVRR